MTVDETIKMAIDAIGEGKADDYIISPTSHAKEFREKAPALAAILSLSAVNATASQYETEDSNALAAQKEFNRAFNRANIIVLTTAILTALMLATGIMAPEPDAKGILLALSLGSVITGAIAAMYLFIIKQGQLLEIWMTKRAFAETTRLNYFDTVSKKIAPPTVESKIPVELLKLEYFRRFQLDVQRAFYRERGKDHQEEAGMTLSLSAWGMAGAAIVAGSAGVLIGAYSPKFAVLAALGMVFTGISTFASMREAVNQNRRNAERYERTSRVLEELNKRLDDVRTAVYNAGTKPLVEFMETVHEQLSLEHRQWLGELSEARGAFARLESTLKEHSGKVSSRQANE